jgi:hypothetical protein
LYTWISDPTVSKHVGELIIVLVQIKSFAELPVLFDEQFCKDHNCEDCGNQLNIDLFLSNTPHFFTIGKVVCLK